MRNFFDRIRHALTTFGLLIHFMTFGYTAILPLLGAATVSPHLSPFQLFGLIAVAFSYHIFAYILNDLIDLPIDRTQPIRAEYPLVRGVINPRQALAFTLIQIPLAFSITALEGGGLRAYIALGASFIFITAYNKWSKYTPLPPLTDLVQGLAWGSLALYGAFMVSAQITALTIWLFVFEIVFIMLINGVGASLRDLENDLKSGGRSTAIILGVRPNAKGGVTFTRRFIFYSLALKTILIGIALFPLAHNDFKYSLFLQGITSAVTLAMVVLSFHALLAAFRSADAPKDMLDAGMLHVLVDMSIPIVWLALYMDWVVLVVLLIVYITPMPFPSYHWVVDPVIRGWRVKAKNSSEQKYRHSTGEHQ